MNWNTVDKFETYFYLGTQPNFEFELAPEKDYSTIGRMVERHKRTIVTSNFIVNLSDVKVASSTDNDEELEQFWVYWNSIMKQSVHSVQAQNSARCLQFDIDQEFSVIQEQYWRVSADFRFDIRSKLNDWIEACGKGLELRLKATLTNVTAYPNVVSGKFVSRDPIWFQRLHTIPSHKALEFGSPFSQMIHEKELRERMEREMPFEKDFRFRGDITFYLRMRRPKLMEIEKEKDFPQVIMERESVNLRLLKEKIHMDMWIVTDSGIRIPCHKCFLAVGSPVIAAMFDKRWATTGSGDVTSNHLKLENVSEETVHAFLDYVYISDISKAMESLPIAVELLQLANKYNVALLEKKLLEYLCKKSKRSENWIPADIDALLKAYLFLEMSGISKLVEILLAKILKEKADEILQSEEFMELEREDFEASIKIRKCWVTQRSPGMQSVFVESLHKQLNCI